VTSKPERRDRSFAVPTKTDAINTRSILELFRLSERLPLAFHHRADADANRRGG